MNCKDVQELLPLHIGRDIEEKLAHRVAEHLEYCTECACLAGEYREAGLLLQLFEPPPFSDGVYAGIRERVWQEIDRESATTRTLPQLFALFRPRIGSAFATAFLLAVSIFSYYFIADRWTVGRQIADSFTPNWNALPGSSGPAVSPQLSGNKDQGPTVKNSGADTPGVGPLARTGQTRRRKGPGPVIHRREAVEALPNDRSMAVNGTRGSNKNEPDTLIRDPGATRKEVRMEMQTKDPNIRIIWFSPQTAKRDSR